jgi:coiled-coil domain-containing protein 63/114
MSVIVYLDLRLPNPGASTGRMLLNSASMPNFGNQASTGLREDTKGSPSGASRASAMASKTLSGGKGDNKPFERVQNFEEAFNKIKSATGITDVEELVKTFIKNEDHNFSLFNYVNEQNNEIEKLEEQIQQLREEEHKFALESGEDFQQHKQILKELENKLQTTDAMAEKYEIRCQDLQRVIESLKRGIQSIYEKFDADDNSSSKDKDKEKDRDLVVTESNMVHYLGLIEQRANLLLQTYAEVKLSVTSLTSKAGVGAAAVNDTTKEVQEKTAVDETVQLTAAKRSVPITSILGSGPKVPMGQDLLHVRTNFTFYHSVVLHLRCISFNSVLGVH